MKFNRELQELSLYNINKHNTRRPRLQSRRIINYINLNFFHTYNRLHYSSKRIDRGLKHESYSKLGTSLIRRSIARGPHFSGPQFTHWSALAVRKFWTAVYPLIGPHFTTARKNRRNKFQSILPLNV